MANYITVNGKRISVANASSISVVKGRVVVDGKEMTDQLDLPENVIKIEVVGTLASLETDITVNCEDVSGNVHANGSVNCDDIGGNLTAGGSVNCDDVGGSIVAGGSVNC